MAMKATSWDAAVKDGSPMTPDSPFPWGKFKGTPIGRVPRDYLMWAMANADGMKGGLRVVTRQVLGLPPEDGEETPDSEAMVRLQGDLNGEAKTVQRAWENAVRRVKELEKEVRTLRAQARIEVNVKLTDEDRFRLLVKQWYRAMSLIHHPDRGGNKEKQTVVNACYGDLLKRLEGDDA
jgi:hypothetical protein